MQFVRPFGTLVRVLRRFSKVALCGGIIGTALWYGCAGTNTDYAGNIVDGGTGDGGSGGPPDLTAVGGDHHHDGVTLRGDAAGGARQGRRSGRRARRGGVDGQRYQEREGREKEVSHWVVDSVSSRFSRAGPEALGQRRLAVRSSVSMRKTYPRRARRQ